MELGPASHVAVVQTLDCTEFVQGDTIDEDQKGIRLGPD